MSSDIEDFYVQRSEPVRPLLPRDVDWEQEDGEYVEYVTIGSEDGWLLFVGEPEPVERDDIPEVLRAAQPNLRFRVAARIEPISPPDEAWELLERVLDAVGGHLGGATFDIRTGHVIVWRDGQRERPSPRPKKRLFGRLRGR
jgi:hypothetical protein